MAPTMPVSALSAGGSRNVIAPCVALRCPRMRYASVACSPGVATSSTQRTEPTCQCSCSKQELPGILTACSYLTPEYQLSNNHCPGQFVHSRSGGGREEGWGPLGRPASCSPSPLPPMGDASVPTPLRTSPAFTGRFLEKEGERSDKT